MCYNVYTAGSNSTKGAEIMDDKKIAYQEKQASLDAQSTYFEEFVYLLSLLSPETKKEFTDYLRKLRDSEDNQEPVSSSRQKET